MDNSNLNKAHFHGRKAEKDLKCGRFEHAINNHQFAYDYLMEAAKSITSVKSLESLKLQCHYHKTQKELIQMKYNLYEKYKNLLEQNKQLDAEFQEKFKTGQFSQTHQLQLAIYKTMEETDRLLKHINPTDEKGPPLQPFKSFGSGVVPGTVAVDTANNTIHNHNKKIIDEQMQLESIMNESKTIITIDNKNDCVRMDRKLPKDNKLAIEQLKTLNHQLHMLVHQLVIELDQSNQVNDLLRDKLSVLQNPVAQQQQQQQQQQQKYQPLVTFSLLNNNINNNQINSNQPTTEQIIEMVTSATSSMKTSPNKELTEQQLKILTESIEEGSGDGDVRNHSYLSCDELSPETTQIHDLPPLELPKFDLSLNDVEDNDLELNISEMF